MPKLIRPKIYLRDNDLVHRFWKKRKHPERKISSYKFEIYGILIGLHQVIKMRSQLIDQNTLNDTLVELTDFVDNHAPRNFVENSDFELAPFVFARIPKLSGDNLYDELWAIVIGYLRKIGGNFVFQADQTEDVQREVVELLGKYWVEPPPEEDEEDEEYQ